MSVDFRESVTKENLMRAFAGESQARNRYTFAAAQAKKEHLHVVEAVFNYTADQERQHAYIFYQHLKEMAGETIEICGGYPVDKQDSTEELLYAAQHNEYEEADDVYQSFGDVAKEEGFMEVASAFYQIAKIEKIHGDRFGKLAELLKTGAYFECQEGEKWMCLNCGHIHSGLKVPGVCPVCRHERGYFIPVSLAPYLMECE